jgi:ABC-type multidrug transport system ATPase subunit
MLGLEDCADNLVGGQVLKGISGGEKRRLSLAVEMLNDPAVLIVGAFMQLQSRTRLLHSNR